jgi:hypothetical protein
LALPSSLFQAAGFEVRASGLWSAGPLGSVVLGLLALASAILELTVALRCCGGAVVGSGSQNPKALGGSIFFLFEGRGRPGEEDGDSGVLGKGLLFVGRWWLQRS